MTFGVTLWDRAACVFNIVNYVTISSVTVSKHYICFVNYLVVNGYGL